MDASALTEYVVNTDTGRRVGARMFGATRRLHTPHLCAIEVTSALRGLVLGKKLTESRAQAARIWQLRHNLTTYDATYIALAEALDATLVTCDRKLAPAYGHYAEVELIA